MEPATRAWKLKESAVRAGKSEILDMGGKT